MYHVDLPLDNGEVKELKRRALDSNTSVKDYIAQLCKADLAKKKSKKEDK